MSYIEARSCFISEAILGELGVHLSGLHTHDIIVQATDGNRKGIGSIETSGVFVVTVN